MRAQPGYDTETLRRVAQIVLAVIAVVAAGAAALLYFGGSRENPFAKRVDVVPAKGPVGTHPFLELHGYPADQQQKVYLCRTAGDPVEDCLWLANGTGAERMRGKAIPPAFPGGDEVIPQPYVLRVGPDETGQYPVRGRFEVERFSIGKKVTGLSFSGIAPSELQLGPPEVVANNVECRPPIWLPDGRLAIGKTVFDPKTGVTIDLDVGVGIAEITWSPTGDKAAILTSDRKEIRLAGPDGSDAVTKEREARGLLSSMTWSAPGDRLAFISQNDPAVPRLGPGPPTVRILNAINGEITAAGPGLAVAWSPSGDLFAVERAGNVIELGNPAGGRRKLTDGRSAAWSPDGRLLAFVRGEDTTAQGYVAKADGTEATPVATGPTCALSFSPGGDAMAIVEDKDGSERLILRDVVRP